VLLEAKLPIRRGGGRRNKRIGRYNSTNFNNYHNEFIKPTGAERWN